MESDDLWFITRWLEGVQLNSDSDPDMKKRKRADGLPMAFGDEDYEGELSRRIEEQGGIVIYSYIEAFKENKIIGTVLDRDF